MEQTIIYIIIIAVLVMLSAYFSATETAFSSLNKTRLKTMAEKSRKAALALKLSESYDKLISVILIGNNIVNITMASIGTIMFVELYGDIGATISTAVITVTVLIFGEISPKSIAKDCPERFAMFAAPIMRLLIWVFTPINFLFSGWKKLLSKLFKLENDTKMSQDELLMLVDEVQQEGSIDENEGDLLRNAIEFTELEAEDILTHRVDLEAVDITATKEEIAHVFSESKFSRILVYRDSIDSIIGAIHLKDFYEASGITEKNIEDIITPTVFVMQGAKISSLMRQLQKEKSHIAVVLDEYGGTYGIVTMEDILEELVGEIWDEHDEVVEPYRKLDSGIHRVDASIDLSDFCEHFDIQVESEMISLSGWVTERLEKIPQKGDCFKYDNLMITVVLTEYHRVLEVDVVVEPQMTQA